MDFGRLTQWLAELTGIDAGAPLASPEDERLRLALRRLFGWLLLGLGLGIGCVARQWHERPTLAVLWSLALYATTFLIGFLFGIPRVLQSDGNVNPSAPVRFQVNTNLEQVSDWLVKILVGLGLTELKQIPADVYRAAKFLAPSLYGERVGPLSVGQVNAVGAVVVYFSVLGFLSGYLITRLLLGTLFRDADERTISPNEEVKILRGTTLPAEPTVDMKMALDPKAAQAAQKIEKLSLKDSIRQGILPEALAVAKLNAGDDAGALEAYRAAVGRSPSDPQLRLNYGLALYQAGKPPSEAVAQLEQARTLAVPDAPRDLRWQIYRYLTFYSLYLPAPDSFEKTIQYANEYVSGTNNRPSAAVYLNLACACGQKAATLQKGSPEFTATRAAALAALKNAIAIGSTAYREMARQLLHPTPTQREQGENDLEIFAGEEFDQVVA